MCFGLGLIHELISFHSRWIIYLIQIHSILEVQYSWVGLSWYLQVILFLMIQIPHMAMVMFWQICSYLLWIKFLLTDTPRAKISRVPEFRTIVPPSKMLYTYALLIYVCYVVADVDLCVFALVNRCSFMFRCICIK